jgi:hypothetical protein
LASGYWILVKTDNIYFHPRFSTSGDTSFPPHPRFSSKEEFIGYKSGKVGPALIDVCQSGIAMRLNVDTCHYISVVIVYNGYSKRR